MIKREITGELNILLKEYPIVTILGPRQSGKTTLASSLRQYQYCNLEVPENRHLAFEDPKFFLNQYQGPVILDEIQRAPELLSYIQARVDENKINGQYILTGSHQLQLKEAIVQSLAGRTAILHLLPFSISELKKSNIEFPEFSDYVVHGFLPRVYDQQQRPFTAYSNYYQTYVERDVRLLINLKDASLFEKFMKLVAGRVGQLVDYNSLANDVGVDAKTIKNWLSALEASFVVFKLAPYFENFGKRIIKSPKYYFMDVGLLAFLLGIETSEQVKRDPLVGNIFENLVVMECLKQRFNQGRMPDLYFFRDSSGNEVDLIYKDGDGLVPMEIKSSSTFSSSLLSGLKKFLLISKQIKKSYLIYNGDKKELSSNIVAINFKNIDTMFLKN